MELCTLGFPIFFRDHDCRAIILGIERPQKPFGEALASPKHWRRVCFAAAPVVPQRVAPDPFPLLFHSPKAASPRYAALSSWRFPKFSRRIEGRGCRWRRWIHRRGNGIGKLSLVAPKFRRWRDKRAAYHHPALAFRALAMAQPALINPRTSEYFRGRAMEV